MAIHTKYPMYKNQPAVYIMTNKRNGTLSIGVTSNLTTRISQHKSGHGSKFTTKYKITTLVYVELADSMEVAIAREKQLKAGSRKSKIALIEKENPLWIDMSEMI